MRIIRSKTPFYSISRLDNIYYNVLYEIQPDATELAVIIKEIQF